MGCGSSLADKAIGLDGYDNVKKYVIQKNKQIFAQHYIKQIQKNICGNVKRLRLKKINQIDENCNLAKKNIDELKVELDKKEPGSIKKAEDLQKMPAQDLLGLGETLKRLESQKSIVNSRYEEQEKEILQQIRQQYQKIHDGFEVSTSKLMHINGLPENDRLKALKWGDQYAQKDIAANNKSLKEQMDSKFDFSNFEHMFDSIVPTKNLQDIVEDGRERALRSSVRSNKCVTC